MTVVMFIGNIGYRLEICPEELGEPIDCRKRRVGFRPNFFNYPKQQDLHFPQTPL